MNITRYNDHIWRVSGSELECAMEFSVEGVSRKDGENERELVEAITRRPIKAGEIVEYHGRKWKVKPRSEHGFIAKKISEKTRLLHPETNSSLQRFSIVAQGKPKHLQSAPQSHSASLEASALAFNDPYTKLASIAYDKGYEENYSAKDNFVPNDCDTCLQVVGNDLFLRTTKTKNNGPTVQQYKDFLLKQFGERKMAEVQKAYGINFDDMIAKDEPLTPEHVYRMNIGLSAVDMDDVRDLFAKLSALQKVLKSKNATTAESISKASGIPLRLIQSFLPQKRASSSEAESSDESDIDTLKEDLQDFCVRLGTLPKEVKECTEEQCRTLLEPFKLEPDAAERALTGRKIRMPLLSGYSTAELGKEKLWVDQQELNQVFEVMRNTDNWDLWLEKLDHVVVKANLLKGNKEEGYRLSAIVPGPKDENGKERYFAVTRCVSNGYGVFTYTIEPFGTDSKLPGIFACRSTASSEYAFHGLDSILNDLNALNPPGYQGQRLNAPYDAAFIKEYTIPTWVGHMVDGQRLLKEGKFDEAYTAFRASNKAIESEETRKYKSKNVGDLVKEYDWLLNDLGIQMGYADLLFSGYLGLYMRLVGTPSDELTETDARDLKAQLIELKKELPQDAETSGIDSLIYDLDYYVIEGTHGKEVAKRYNDFFATNFRKVDTFAGQVHLAYQRKSDDIIPDILNEWSNALNKRAVEAKELPEHKRKNGLYITGQSLGGAISQVTLCRQLVQEDRIPVPNSEVHTYTISSPGIRQADQKAFVEYASRTSELRDALGANLAITHLTEAADFVFLTGQGHLGAAYNTDEREMLAKSVVFRAEVREMIPGAMDYATVHATQFMEGSPGKHYDLTPITPADLASLDGVKAVVVHNPERGKELLAVAKRIKQMFMGNHPLTGALLEKIPKNSLLIRRHLVKSQDQTEQKKQGVFIVNG